MFNITNRRTQSLAFFIISCTVLQASHAVAGNMNKQLSNAVFYDKTFYYPYGKARLGFHIKQTATNTKGKYSVTITPIGYSKDNTPFTLITDSLVYQSEIDDLNRDGYPELMVYSHKKGRGNYGEVQGYSSNNNKSVSSIAIPDLTTSQKQGYKGKDDFAIVEGMFIRRFPIATEKDKTRQIQYKLVDGEASRQLIVEKTLTY